MARAGVDPIVRYGVLGVLGFVGWNWASAQPTTSPFRHSVDQVRAMFKPRPSSAAPPAGAPPASRPSSPPTRATPPGAAIVETGRRYAVHDDGFCWQEISYSDGHIDYFVADPSNCGMQTIAPGQAMQATSLVDVGGFPLVLDPNLTALRQDPALGGTNVYGPGDVVLDSTNGTQYLIQAGRGGLILAGPDGSFPAVDQFFA
jgi:hypothetical protein